MNSTDCKTLPTESGATPVPERHRLMSLAVSLILCLAIWAVYSQVGSHAFVSFDTPDYITDNPFVQAGLTRASIAWAFTTTHAANWHPLTWLSHMADVT